MIKVIAAMLVYQQKNVIATLLLLYTNMADKTSLANQELVGRKLLVDFIYGSSYSRFLTLIENSPRQNFSINNDADDVEIVMMMATVIIVMVMMVMMMTAVVMTTMMMMMTAVAMMMMVLRPEFEKFLNFLSF